MAEQETTPDTATATDQDMMPQAGAIAQYVKDFSAENPSAPQVFQWHGAVKLDDPSVSLNVNRVSEEVHEVVLRIQLKASSEQGTHFIVDLTYAGLFGLRNVPEEALAPFLLVEAPRLLFPFVRQIIAEAVQNLGFPPVLLDPIDFGAAYMAQLEADNGAPGNGEQQLADVEPAGNA